MKVLVTGGAGFIGSHLVDRLLGDGHQVRVYDNLSTGSSENLRDKPVELVVGDVADFDRLAPAMAACDLVYHQAALVSVPRSIEEPMLNYQTNIAGTFNVFEAARRAGVKRVVYASSSAIYGEQQQLPLNEACQPQPISPYAQAKLIDEQLAHSYNHSYGMCCIGLRYMNVYGPRQRPDSPYSGVISIFASHLLDGQPINVYGDGRQTRDFVYVDDVVAANILAGFETFDRQSMVFNIGGERQTSVNELIACLGVIIGRDAQAHYLAERNGDIRHSYADIGRARRVLDYRPQVAFEDGLRHTVDWFRSSGV